MEASVDLVFNHDGKEKFFKRLTLTKHPKVTVKKGRFLICLV